MFCLNQNLVNKFLDKLKSGEIDPQKLSMMTSEARRDFFGFLGKENAKQVNAQFESKLLLKDQQRGMINWAKKLAGLKPEVKRDIISRVNKMEKILDPLDEKAFLQDWAESKLGMTVSLEEVKKISDLARKTSQYKESIMPGSPIQSPERMAYGRALFDFGDYVSGLKNEAKKLSFSDFKNAPLQATLKGASNIGGLAKSLKASLDNSVIGKQGLKVLFSNPEIWLKNSVQTYVDMFQTFAGKNVQREIIADVLSRPNAINGLYAKEKLAIGAVEEAYPTSLPEKIPVLGKAFKASENAFTGFQYRSRADIFDKYVEIADKSGEGDIRGIGKIANSLTGRGTFGQRLEGSASFVNNIFFSPRFLKSNVDLLSLHAFDKDISPFARKQAAVNVVKVISGVAAILAIAEAVKPGSIEKDPRSSDFGKIRIGDTRFDVSGGMASIITLASRLIPTIWGQGYSKSSTSGKIQKINSGKFGAPTGQDVVFNFFTNKLSPVGSVVRDMINEKDFDGDKTTFTGELSNLGLPMPIATYEELKNNPNSADTLLSMIADAHGFSANTYSKRK